MKKKLCYCEYDLSIKISPVTPVSNKMVGVSDFPLILIIHRETKCLFEIATKFISVKIKTKIKNVMVFANDWMQKLRFFLIGRWGNFDRELG